MPNRFAKKIFCTVITVFLIIISAFSASAENSYNYDSWGNDVDAPLGYTVSKTIGYSASSPLKTPADIYYRNGSLYVLDSGNRRVVIYDKDYNYKGVIDKFYELKNGEKVFTELSGSRGIFVTDDEKIVIADTDNYRVIICKNNGEIVNILTKPQSDNFSENLQFRPIKVVVDDLNNTYVLSEGFYYGAIVYNENGEYRNFFGSNKVRVTAAMLAERFWRQFMSNKQKDYTKNYLPAAFTSFDIDGKNFIYTVTSEKSGAIRKLNSLGNDIFSPEQGPDPLDKTIYGDRKDHWLNGAKYDTVLCDITVSKDDFIYILDRTRGRIFEYDKESNLINVFGNKGNASGTFKEPVAIQAVEDDILVLDQDKAQISVFSATDYGKLVNGATVLYHDGLFDDAYDMWNKVLSNNSNCELAYRGIGRAYLQRGDYKEAMKYAKLGQDRLGYSKAFRFYRSDTVGKYFVPIFAVIVILAVAFKIIKSKLKKSNSPGRIFKVKKVLLNPITFYEALQKDKSVNTLVKSSIVVAFFFLGQIMSSLGTGFIFNKNNITQFNIFFVIAQSLGLVAMWVLSEMVVGSLRFGHGTLRGVYCGTSAALIPYTIAIYINLILSQFLVYEEMAIMNIVSTVGLLYTVYLLYQSVRLIQKYDVAEAAFSMLLDAVVVIIVILLLIIIYMLIRQMAIFGTTIYQEIAFRIN